MNKSKWDLHTQLFKEGPKKEHILLKPLGGNKTA